MSTISDSGVNLWCPFCGLKSMYYPRGNARVECVECKRKFRVLEGRVAGKAARERESQSNGRIDKLAEHIKRVEAGHDKLEEDYAKEKFRNRWLWKIVGLFSLPIGVALFLKIMDM